MKKLEGRAGLSKKDLKRVVEAIGFWLVKLPPVASMARHSTLGGTLYYLDPADQEDRIQAMALEYVSDVVNRMSSEKLMEKWFLEGPFGVVHDTIRNVKPV